MDYNSHISYRGFSDPAADRSILKDGAGRFRVNLFAEFNKSNHEDSPPMYTMRETSWNGLPSAYLIYMLSSSEYEAAMRLVGSWAHWQKLCKCRQFMEGPDESQWGGLDFWREEKETREKAAAYDQLRASAAEGNVQAMKIVYAGDKPLSKRGRPSKEEIDKAAKEAAELRTSIKDDLNRIRLVNNGNAK